MASFRLLDIYTGEIASHQLCACPPYVAISHAWSEALFPPDVEFLTSPGYPMLLAATKERFAGVTHCWTDTICIDQSDEADKLRQIPLMGRIFGDAVAVFILQGIELGLDQEEVEECSRQLKPAIEMHETESWSEHGMYWQSCDGGRSLIVQGMRGISRLTRTAWTTRVWTLQEYILGRRIVWVGLDLKPITVSDILFAALPDICDTLHIEECLGSEFQKVYSFFSGMANTRLGRGDRTRVMELLGNRSASVPCDEVYGVMAASGVEIHSLAGLDKEQAWQLWCEEAVGRGHIRWLLMPEVLNESPPAGTRNCAFPPFIARHKASSGSGLDSLTPLFPTSVEQGTADVSGRWIGSCKVIARLGSVHEPSSNRIHRDITLLLFAKGRWQMAYRIASVFGAGRYNARQLRVIARVLTNNYWQCKKAVDNQGQNSFRPRFSDEYQAYVWSDFMKLQMGQMPAMNDGIAYLAQIVRSEKVCTDAVIILGDYMPSARLEVIDVGGRTVDGRCVFMVIERPPPAPPPPSRSRSFCSPGPGATASNHATWFLDTTLHKVAVTLPITDAFEAMILHLPLVRFKIGGQSCWSCGADQWQTMSIPSARAQNAMLTQSQSSASTQEQIRRSIRRRAFHERRALRLMVRRSQLQNMPIPTNNGRSSQRYLLNRRMRRDNKRFMTRLRSMEAIIRLC